MRAVFKPDKSDLMNGVYRFFKEKKLISKENSGVTFKTSGGDPYSFLGATSLSDGTSFATGSESGTWMLMKLPKPLFITHYSAATISSYPNYFRNWKVEGRNNDTSWHIIDDYSEEENNIMKEGLKSYLYNVQHRGKYEYIKLTMYRTARTDMNNAHISLTGFELFGFFPGFLYTSQRKFSISFSYVIFIFAVIS